jgi:uncharacterized protein (TIGR02594 family)
MNTLKLGSRGLEVTRLQLALNEQIKPSPRLKADGNFGGQTQAAVILLQKNKGLVADGVVGPKTWAALGQKPAVLPVQPLAPVSSQAASWMSIAQSQLKTRENSAPGVHNQKIIAYHQTTTLRATADEIAWCSSFVNWVIIQSGRKGTNSAAAKSWLAWGSPLATPQVGAVTVIKKKSGAGDHATGSTSGFHVAFFLKIDDTHIRLLGGNQSNEVRESAFPLKKYDVKGYRWPQ